MSLTTKKVFENKELDNDLKLSNSLFDNLRLMDDFNMLNYEEHIELGSELCSDI